MAAYATQRPGVERRLDTLAASDSPNQRRQTINKEPGKKTSGSNTHWLQRGEFYALQPF